jgi:hypothetical protein
MVSVIAGANTTYLVRPEANGRVTSATNGKGREVFLDEEQVGRLTLMDRGSRSALSVSKETMVMELAAKLNPVPNLAPMLLIAVQ